MKPTATQILQRCKDIVEGRHSQPEPFTIKKTGNTRWSVWSVYYPTGALMANWYEDEKGSSTTAIFARILGMDSEPAPAPEIVLEWVEHVGYPSEFYGKTTATYNAHLSAEILTIGNIRLPRILLDGSILYEDVHENEVGFSEKWCADTIKAIVTQTPKQ